MMRNSVLHRLMADVSPYVLTISSGAEMLGGGGGGADQGGGDGGGGGGGGGADQGGGTGDQGGGGGGEPWYATVSDSVATQGELSHKAWLDNKGFKSLDDAVTSYRNLEKAHGSGRFNVPKDASDAAAWDATFKALGRPDSPEGYKIAEVLGVPAGGTVPEFASGFAAEAHKAGLLPAQVAAVAQWYAGQEAAQDAAFGAQAEKDMAELKGGQGWGDKFDANLATAQAAAKQFGFDQAKMEKLERALGTRGLMEFMHDLGKKVGEDTLEGGGGRKLGGMTGPQAAEAKKTFMANPDKVTALQRKDPQVKAEWDAINAALAAELDRQQAA